LRAYGEPAEGTAFDLKIILRLFSFVKPHARRMTLAFFLMLASSALSLAAPYLIKIAIDDHIAAGNASGLLRIAVLTAAVFAALYVTTAGQSYLLSWVGQKVLATLRRDVFGHLQRLHLGYHDTHIKGATLSRLINDVAIINQFLSQGLVTFVGDLLLLAGIITVMLAMSPLLALLTFAVLPLMVLTTYLFARKARVAFGRTRSRVAAVVGGLAENLSGMRVIQAFAQEKAAQARFDQLNGDNRDSHVSAMTLSFIFLPMVEFLGILATAVVLWFGGHAVASGSITLGTVIAFLAYVTRFFQPIREISQIYTTMQAAMAGGEKVIDLLDTPPAIADAAAAVELSPMAGRVEFRNVSFAYTEGVPVLTGIDLRVEPGRMVALVGQTGAGKTTIANLAARFYDVTSGQILVDGVDIRQIIQRSLRGQMGLVSQEPFLFSGTIADNIRFGAPEAAIEAVQEAARAANVYEFIEELEEGYETRIQEGGANLSVGQRQLICIARAILVDPKIIILDEATASVDTLTEILIQKALERLFADRTAIVIAHRLSTVRRAHEIAVLHEGRIVERGTHGELVEKRGRYRDLYNRQFLDPTGSLH
jgi:ABC-type multidrug transport system fused ATPase/permease subunit